MPVYSFGYSVDDGRQCEYHKDQPRKRHCKAPAILPGIFTLEDGTTRNVTDQFGAFCAKHHGLERDAQVRQLLKKRYPTLRNGRSVFEASRHQILYEAHRLKKVASRNQRGIVNALLVYGWSRPIVRRAQLAAQR